MVLRDSDINIASEMQISLHFFVLEDEIQDFSVSLEKNAKSVLKNINHSDIAGFFSWRHSMTF